jgi:formate dehydrogenase iron-sulfur subunit
MPKKFLLDMYVNRCLRCGGCMAVCKTHNRTPEGVHRIRVITFDEGEPTETNMPMPCLHCNEPPCMYVCPTKAIYKRKEDGIVLVNKDTCIGCGYCLMACPFGAPQFEKGTFGNRGKMDKCTFCVEPYEQKDEQGRLIQREPKPRCAMVCATGHLLAGDADEISAKLRERVGYRMSRGVEKTFLTF